MAFPCKQSLESVFVLYPQTGDTADPIGVYQTEAEAEQVAAQIDPDGCLDLCVTPYMVGAIDFEAYKALTGRDAA